MFGLWIGIIVFTIIFIIILIYLFYELYAMFSGAPFVPTSYKKVKKIIELAKLTKDDKLIDLGSGDGRLTLEASKYCNHATGVEISPILYWVSKLKRIKERRKNVTFIRNTLWNIDLGTYNVVSIYFIPHWMKKLKKKIIKEMNVGSRIVSHGFTFPDWEPVVKDGPLYVYELNQNIKE